MTDGFFQQPSKKEIPLLDVVVGLVGGTNIFYVVFPVGLPFEFSLGCLLLFLTAWFVIAISTFSIVAVLEAFFPVKKSYL